MPPSSCDHAAVPADLAAVRRGAGRRLVLVHGFTQTHASWTGVAEDLATDHEVVAVDLPGHGGSGALRADLWRSADLVGEAGGAATYVGYSLGARTCLHLALRRPDLVERLVLLGGTAGIDDTAARDERRRADDDLASSIERDGVDAFLDRWLALPLFAGLPAEQRSGAAFDERRANTAAGLAASLRDAGTGTQAPLWDRLGELRAPVLVLAGSRDEKFTTLGRRLAAGVGPGSRFEAVPGAGHAAHLERPAAFVTILRAWLAATGG